MLKKILVTGGSGFIGSSVIKYLINQFDYEVINVDKLTYAGNLLNVDSVKANRRFHFKKIDILFYVNSANGPFGLIAKLFGKKTLIYVDGVEW